MKSRDSTSASHNSVRSALPPSFRHLPAPVSEAPWSSAVIPRHPRHPSTRGSFWESRGLIEPCRGRGFLRSGSGPPWAALGGSWPTAAGRAPLGPGRRGRWPAWVLQASGVGGRSRVPGAPRSRGQCWHWGFCPATHCSVRGSSRGLRLAREICCESRPAVQGAVWAPRHLMLLLLGGFLSAVC